MSGTTSPLLLVEDLRVAFPNRDGGMVEAVRGVSFTLGRERLGIVGESGSGKSQTGRALLGLTAPEGRVTARRLEFSGTDLLRCSPRQRRELRGGRIAMVLQDPKFSLNPVMRIGPQIEETLRAHTRVSGREARARAFAALESVSIDDPERVYKLYPHEVSGGMGQRIAIARALILEPQILLLDEPTSALDASVQAEVLNLLEALRRRRGLTFVMVSHDLAVVTHLCERLMVMQRGQTVEFLSASDLAAHRVTSAYTLSLMHASSGFKRAAEPGHLEPLS